MDGANVRSIQSIEDLAAGLHAYSAKTTESLYEIDQEIIRTQQWLAQRVDHWYGELRHCQQSERKIREKLEDLKAIPVESTHAPSRSMIEHYERTCRNAVVSLDYARAQHMAALRWQAEVSRAVANYQRQERSLTTLLGQGVAKGVKRLRRNVDLLKLYIASPLTGNRVLSNATDGEVGTSLTVLPNVALSYIAGQTLTRRTTINADHVSIQLEKDANNLTTDNATTCITVGSAELLVEEDGESGNYRLRVVELAVEAADQKQEVGIALLEQAEQFALSLGVSEICGTVSVDEVTYRCFVQCGYQVRNDANELYKLFIREDEVNL